MRDGGISLLAGNPWLRVGMTSLTDRQRQIIDLLSEPGASQASVAASLGIEVQTVKNHLHLAYRTLGVRTLAQAVRMLSKRRARIS